MPYSECHIGVNNVATAPDRYVDFDADNVATLVKTAQTNMYGYVVVNPNGSAAYVQLFNAAAAGDVTVGTTTPDDFIFVPANGAADFISSAPIGAFPLGLVLACTTTATGSTDPTTGLELKVLYK